MLTSADLYNLLVSTDPNVTSAGTNYRHRKFCKQIVDLYSRTTINTRVIMFPIELYADSRLCKKRSTTSTIERRNGNVPNTHAHSQSTGER